MHLLSRGFYNGLIGVDDCVFWWLKDVSYPLRLYKLTCVGLLCKAHSVCLQLSLGWFLLCFTDVLSALWTLTHCWSDDVIIYLSNVSDERCMAACYLLTYSYLCGLLIDDWLICMEHSVYVLSCLKWSVICTLVMYYLDALIWFLILTHKIRLLFEWPNGDVHASGVTHTMESSRHAYLLSLWWYENCSLKSNSFVWNVFEDAHFTIVRLQHPSTGTETKCDDLFFCTHKTMFCQLA